MIAKKKKQSKKVELVNSPEFKIEKIAVIGAGAVGGFYGAKLGIYGKKVFFHSKSMFDENVRSLKIQSIWGNFTLIAEVHPDTRNLPIVDMIIISAKATNPVVDILDYTFSIKKIITKNTPILVLQNGINMEEYLAFHFPENPILGGLAFTCINREKRGLIKHLDYGLVKIGVLEKKHNLIAKKIVELFQNAGIQTEYEANLRKARYEKLLWNVPFNTLSVVFSMLTDELIRSSHSRKLAEELMTEVQFLAKLDRVSIKSSDIRTMIEKTEKMKPYHTSMLLDYLSKNRLETEVILGELLVIAKKHRVRIPKIEVMYLILKRLEEKILNEK